MVYVDKGEDWCCVDASGLCETLFEMLEQVHLKSMVHEKCVCVCVCVCVCLCPLVLTTPLPVTGPEIDSPDKEKRASIEELISDVSGLNLDACSPSHSKTSPKGVSESETHTTETVVRQYRRGQAEGVDTPSNHKPVTVYETIC